MTSPWAWLVLVAMAAASTPSIPPVGAVNFYADRYMDDDDNNGNRNGNDRSHRGDDRDGSRDQTCPEMCACYSRSYASTGSPGPLLTVNCSGLGLIDFPASIPNRTEVLDMSRNKLQNLTSLPRLSQLRVLDMSSNWMRHLDNQWVFEHVSKLRIISLADNALQSLQHGSFSGLKELRELDLSRNIIKRIEMHAFGGLNSLETLLLNRNELYQLKREWFLSLTSLTSLHIAHNFVATLESNAFSKLAHLQHLDLSQNSLQLIPDDAFSGLSNLKLLNLSGNTNLREVPCKAIQSSSGLNILLLDRIAPSRLQPFGVSDMNVVEMSLSFLPRLRVVEKSAFHNLTRLQTLQLHDNPRLVFLHPSAFSSLPSLRHLLIHNNGLIAISSRILTSLPSLVDLHLHHNPLHCDCNIYWLRKELSRVYRHEYKTKVLASSSSSSNTNLPSPDSGINPGSNTSSTSTASSISTVSSSNDNSITPTATFINEPDRVSCFFPTGKSSMPLVQLPIQYFSPTCPPTTLPLFPALINISLGDELWLECQGLGVPIPSVSWILPGGQEVNYSTSTQLMQDSKSPVNAIEIVEETLLYIKSVTLSDSGSYGCHAVNSIGEDYSTTIVHVRNKPLTLSKVEVSNDYITVSWRGSIPRTQMSDFQLYYREISRDNISDNGGIRLGGGNSIDEDKGSYDVIFLHGSIHKCTIAGLKPQTTYQVCLVYKQTHPVECQNYTTTNDVQVVRADGIVRVSKTHIAVGVVSVVGLLVLIGTLLIIRRVRHRKDYQDPLAEDEKSSIPLDSMNSTSLSTPLTSSRTALLTNSQI